MLFAVLVGLLIAVASFGVLEFVVLKRFRQHTLPCLIVAVGGGLLLAMAFAEPFSAFYQMGWMLGMSVCVAIGFTVKNLRRK